MKRAIRLLQVEDSAGDAEIVAHRLRRAGYEVSSLRVDSEEQMCAALAAEKWDLVIADYWMPQFSAPEALRLFQKAKLDIPFIVVSGTIGEDTAVSMMKAGAHDYLLKDRLERLPPAVERELKDAALRQEKREAEEKLRAAYTELETIYANAPVLMFAVDRAFRVEKINQLAARYGGRSIPDCAGKPVCDVFRCTPAQGEALTPPCRGCTLYAILSDALGSGTRHDAAEVWIAMAEGGEQPRCLLVSVAPLGEGEARSALVCAQDVTQLKLTERSLEQSVRSLQSALAQNTVLFQEVHHRVKNNLQIVASLLAMKARKGKQNIGVDDLRSCERRIRSMALIHELLYSQKDMTGVDFAHYVSKIVPELIGSYERENAIDLRLDLHPVSLSIDQSIPCGLILNELVTNAAKYAYPDGRGEILIQLAAEEGAVRMTVADRGIGMPSTASGPGTSLGMQLVHMLAKQLGGGLEFGGSPGTRVTLQFPLVR
jgi:two-component sensor histidine kinase